MGHKRDHQLVFRFASRLEKKCGMFRTRRNSAAKDRLKKCAFIAKDTSTSALFNTTERHAFGLNETWKLIWVARIVLVFQKGAVQWMKNGFGLGTDRALKFFPRYSMVGSAANGEYNLRVSWKTIHWRDYYTFNCSVRSFFNRKEIWIAWYVDRKGIPKTFRPKCLFSENRLELRRNSKCVYSIRTKASILFICDTNDGFLILFKISILAFNEWAARQTTEDNCSDCQRDGRRRWYIRVSNQRSWRRNLCNFCTCKTHCARQVSVPSSHLWLFPSSSSSYRSLSQLSLIH